MSDSLKLFRDPEGWGISLTAYRQYVQQEIADQMTFDTVSELMHELKCSLEELADKIVEAKMHGAVTARQVAASRTIPPEPTRVSVEEIVGPRDLRSQVNTMTDALQSLIRSQQDTACRVLRMAAEIEALKGRLGPC